MYRDGVSLTSPMHITRGSQREFRRPVLVQMTRQRHPCTQPSCQPWDIPIPATHRISAIRGSVSFAVKIGLVDSRLLNDNEFTRGDVAVISKNALSQPLRNSSKTLFQRLADEGIIKDAPNQGNGDKPGQDDEKTDLSGTG